MTREEAIAAGMEVREIQHSMKRRTPWHDYSRKGTYMLTLVVRERRAILGSLRGCLEGEVMPYVELSALGNGIVQQEQQKINLRWLKACREHMKDNATIWISGTHHNIFSVQQQLIKLGFKILNVITWAKTNTPPNISCRYFTYSTEFIIWARKSQKKPHYFNYDLMKKLNGDRQMTDVWQLPAIGK